VADPIAGLIGRSPFSLLLDRPSATMPVEASNMFSVTEAEAALIRDTYHRTGELGAAVELRRMFPGVPSHRARSLARIVVGWQPEIEPSESCRVIPMPALRPSGVAARA
jgi:hypothetical protein